MIHQHLRKLLGVLRGGKKRRTITSGEEYVEYLETLDVLYEDIRVNGFKSLNELSKGFSLDEVTVNIGRNGEYMVSNGHHRVSIL